MSDEDDATTLRRRHLLRGGALVAGAVAMTAAVAPRAEAADADPVLVGEQHTGTRATSLTIADNREVPTLGLINGDGPSLYLAPLRNDWDGSLDVGEVANTYAGPLIGVSSGPDAGPTTSYLATGLDLAAMPTPVAYVEPDRVLDTRTAAGRQRVVRTSPAAYASGGRLKPGAWLDVAIQPADGDFTVEGAFLNVTSIDSLNDGFLATYPPGDRPQLATTRFQRGQVATSSAFMAVGPVGNVFAIRVYSSTTSHVILDITGVSVNQLPGPVAVATVKRQASRRRSVAVRPQRLGTRRGRS